MSEIDVAPDARRRAVGGQEGGSLGQPRLLWGRIEQPSGLDIDSARRSPSKSAVPWARYSPGPRTRRCRPRRRFRRVAGRRR